MLFLGSSAGNSQLLALPGPIASLASMSATRPSTPPQWAVTERALIKSLAPVQDCVLVPDAQGGWLQRTKSRLLGYAGAGACMNSWCPVFLYYELLGQNERQ